MSEPTCYELRVTEYDGRETSEHYHTKDGCVNAGCCAIRLGAVAIRIEPLDEWPYEAAKPSCGPPVVTTTHAMEAPPLEYRLIRLENAVTNMLRSRRVWEAYLEAAELIAEILAEREP